MKRFFLPAAILLMAASCSPTPQVDLSTLLDEMTDRDAVTRFPKTEFTLKQISSYDRRSIAKDQPGWFANNDGAGYERIDTVGGRLEKVMMDCEGPGAVTRIWMTTNDKRGTIRIYFDNAQEPDIVIPAYDMKRFPAQLPEAFSLTHTHYKDDIEKTGGNTFFLPLPYAKNCKITLEEPDINVFKPRYYQINYRTYGKDVTVKTFSLEQLTELDAVIQEAGASLAQPACGGKCACTDKNGESACGCISHKNEAMLAEAQSMNLDIKAESSQKVCCLCIDVRCPDEFNIGKILEGLCLTASFDGTQCIKASLSNFCGAGYDAPKVEGWWLSNDGNGQICCRFPMPFQNSASFSIANNSGANDINVTMTAMTCAYSWDEQSLYFHCTQRSEKAIHLSPDIDAPDNVEWNFVNITGRGVYVGDLLSLYNDAVDWYGEGDEKIWVDDDSFPSHFGTGTEDYYNCSWAPVVPFLTPFGGAPRADEASSHGYNAFLRTRILDRIPFKKSLNFDIEMLSWHPGTADYNSTAFWYGDIFDKANGNF